MSPTLEKGETVVGLIWANVEGVDASGRIMMGNWGGHQCMQALRLGTMPVIQGIHQTFYSQRRWLLSWPYPSSTILLLYAWRWYIDHVIQILCSSLNWSPEDRVFVWCQDKHGKCLLPHGEPKPCTPNPKRNGLEIIKGILGFIECWKIHHKGCSGYTWNHWLFIGIKLVLLCKQWVSISNQLWHKDFVHKVRHHVL